MIPAQKAWPLADRIVAALAPYCQRIEVAGSLRRARPQVGDIDIVALPHPGQEEGLRSRAKARCRVVSEGDQSLVLTLANGWQLDLWIAQPDRSDLLETVPSNWGTLLLCRTGSKEHNIWLARRAHQLGLHWQPHQGVLRDGRVIASRTEEEVYAALAMRWVPPGLRYPPIPEQYCNQSG